MRRIIYDFAMTIDHFICHEDGSAEGFIPDGEHVTDYQERLLTYDTVLMGRKTYEFGYEYGLKCGERAYPHMEHYIFSRSMQLDSDQVNVVAENAIDRVKQIRAADGNAIYLCGGSEFAGLLLEHGLIDQLVIKLNPICFGTGIRAFGTNNRPFPLDMVECKPYDNGVVLLRYNVDNQRHS